ncbi:hypothetical protein [Pontibacter populi]|uniref:Uncharacterized protein n=1 Tax=Pontibacter populi TaxID=890055 RepID=A0ABV1RR93_9BACT
MRITNPQVLYFRITNPKEQGEHLSVSATIKSTQSLPKSINKQ